MKHAKGIGAKFEAFGWNVVECEDGNDVEQIYDAIQTAYRDQGRADLHCAEHGQGQGRYLCRRYGRAFFSAVQGAVGRSHCLC